MMESINPRQLSKAELTYLEQKIKIFLDFLKDDIFSNLPEGRWTKLESFIENDDRAVPEDAKEYVQAIIEEPAKLFEDQFSLNEKNTKHILVVLYLLSFVIENESLVITFTEKYLNELLDYKVNKRTVKKIYVYLKLFCDIYNG